MEPEGRRLLGKPRSRAENNTKMGIRGMELEGVSWTHLARQGPVSMVKNIWVPGLIKLFGRCLS